MSQAMRKLTAIIGKSRTILIFINQIRMKIGVMFGNPETTTGGNALKFYASVRLEVRKTETIEGGKDEDAVGNRVRVKVVKNKVAPPFRRTELDIIFGKGISATGSLLDAAAKYNIIEKKGAWYSYGEEKVGQGRDSAKEYLELNPEFAKMVETKLREIIFPGREFPTAKGGAKNAATKGTPVKDSAAKADPAKSGAGEVEAPGATPAASAAPPDAAAVPTAAPTSTTEPAELQGSISRGAPAAHAGPGRPKKAPPADPSGDPSGDPAGSAASDALF
jgi:recombination protein RecA